VSRRDERAIPFVDYLDAKFALDDRSLNEFVRSALCDELGGRAHLNCLDLGTGTGAMILRLMKWFPYCELSITALDCDPAVLDTAHRRIADEFRRTRFTVTENGSRLTAESIGTTVKVDFVCSRLADFSPPPTHYHLVTAHAFADLVGPQSLLERLESWVIPEGYVYATLNYDSGTSLFPTYDDPEFERSLLQHYDRSMENRRVEGEPIGGARSGLRLISALADRHWTTIAYGSSDWNLTPVRGAYRDRDGVCVQAMLEFIRNEAATASFDPDDLSRWSGTRSSECAESRLGMIVHQLDVLARKPSLSSDASA
jgi:SAM-dependent methyltransferase